MSKKIAYLTSQYTMPSLTFIRREVDELRRRGVDISIISIRRPPACDILSERDRRDVEETFFVLPSSPLKVLAGLLRTFFKRPGRWSSTLRATLRHRLPGVKNFLLAYVYFVEGMIVSDELDARGIVHVHNHFANPSAIAGYAATMYLDIGWSLTLHGTADFDYPPGPLLPQKIAHADFLAFVSYFGRAQAMRVSPPEHWSKMFICRCGVDLSSLPPKPRRSGGRLRLVQVARLSPEKGQIGLIESFSEIIKRGIDAELVIVGDGPDQERIRKRIESLELSLRVLLSGRAAEAEALERIAGADILVLSSFMEGLPVVLMEALAMGVPVIAPAIAGVPELVEHRVSGLTFAAGNWVELAERMMDLALDPGLRERLATAGKARVESEYAIERAVEPLLRRFLAL